MGRPRESTDGELFAATARVMQRRGPAQLTLAEVAKEAGVVPATLVLRFGSKRNLLLATCRSGIRDVGAQFAAGRAKHQSPMKALLELYVECSSFAATPESLAIGLAYLQNDLTDSDFRAVTREQFQATRRETRKILDEAVAAGELVRCDTAALARFLQQVFHGSMVDWAVFRKGTLRESLRRDLEALVRPYRNRADGNQRKRKAVASG